MWKRSLTALVASNSELQKMLASHTPPLGMAWALWKTIWFLLFTARWSKFWAPQQPVPVRVSNLKVLRNSSWSLCVDFESWANTCTWSYAGHMQPRTCFLFDLLFGNEWQMMLKEMKSFPSLSPCLSDNFGLRRPPWFCFTPSYWCSGRKTKNRDDGHANILLQENGEVPSANPQNDSNIEQVPPNMSDKNVLRSGFTLVCAYISSGNIMLFKRSACCSLWFLFRVFKMHKKFKDNKKKDVIAVDGMFLFGRPDIC